MALFSLATAAVTASAARASISSKRQGKSYAYAFPPIPHSQLCVFCIVFLHFSSWKCGFNLQFAAAVIWQIVCRKNKRRRRSSLAPTIQQLRRWRRRLRRGTDFGRGQFILPGTLLPYPAMMGLLCLAALLILAPAATPAGCCHTPQNILPSLLFAVQRLSEVQIVCQVFSQQLQVFSSAIWSVIELNEQINLWPHSRLSVASRYQPLLPLFLYSSL